MTNRQLAYIVKDQRPLVLPVDESVRRACGRMCERRSGSILVVDTRQRLVGIFTGRDAVRLLARVKEDAGSTLWHNPVTLTPQSRAVDALRAMAEGGFRHLPVTGDLKEVIW
jgi:CBS domain-containing protein